MRSQTVSCLIVAGALAAFGGCAMNRTPTEQNQSMSEKVDDGWITTKIKSSFVADNLVSVANIHVNTDNGVVHLSGTAKDQQEINRAIDIARNVKGVRSVRNEMQIQGVGSTR